MVCDLRRMVLRLGGLSLFAAFRFAFTGCWFCFCLFG